MRLPALAAIAARMGLGLGPPLEEAGKKPTAGIPRPPTPEPDYLPPPPPSTKFTAEELAYVRSLPKKEKKRAVEALQEKYRKAAHAATP